MSRGKTALKPRYMKVDVEGHDLDCISSLAALVSRPRFFSIELPPAEEVAALADVFSMICIDLVVWLSSGEGPAAEGRCSILPDFEE